MSRFLKNTFYIFLTFCCVSAFPVKAFSLNAENIIAYPVPFNPNINKILRIGYKQGITPETIDKVSVRIYDINGDTVFTREYSSLNISWNGRNQKGSLVKSGLYIIHITIENTSTGEYSSRKIRILIAR